MIIYRIEKQKYADTWPCRGALYGEGRWNQQGFWIVYCSESVALASLEVLANSVIFPKNRVLFTITLQNDAPIAEIADLPAHWQQLPYSSKLQQRCEKVMTASNSVALKVPSAVVPQEHNYLLYPPHPQFNDFVQLIEVTPFSYDQRLKRKL